MIFSGRRIIITGGAKGIGYATLKIFADQGAKVSCLDNDAVALADLTSIKNVFAFCVDITDTVALENAVSDAVAAMGGIDGLVNCAGIDLVSDLATMSDAAWDRVMDVNLTAPMKLCRAALPHLKAAGKATIVNVSSGAGLQPLTNRSAYSASKAGLQMFSKALALELADVGIRVNVVCPGAVETPLFRSSIDNETEEEALARVRSRYALKRIASAEEIAAGIVWMSSDAASYVTGSTLAIDGGRTFH